MTFCLFISSTEFVEDRFRFLDKGDEDVCSEETESDLLSNIFQNQEDLEKQFVENAENAEIKITKTSYSKL